MIGAKTITKRSLFFFFFFSLVISTCYGSFVIQCILLLLSYNFLQVIENYCNNLQRGYTMQIFFFHYHLSYNYSTMQKKDDCKTTNRWDYLFTILHLAISKALNFPLWFESRAPWTIFNFSPPSLFESLWRMTNGRSSFAPPPIRNTKIVYLYCYPSPIDRHRWSSSGYTAGRNLEDSWNRF